MKIDIRRFIERDVKRIDMSGVRYVKRIYLRFGKFSLLRIFVSRTNRRDNDAVKLFFQLWRSFEAARLLFKDWKRRETLGGQVKNDCKIIDDCRAFLRADSSEIRLRTDARSSRARLIVVNWSVRSKRQRVSKITVVYLLPRPTYTSVRWQYDKLPLAVDNQLLSRVVLNWNGDWHERLLISEERQRVGIDEHVRKQSIMYIENLWRNPGYRSCSSH